MLAPGPLVGAQGGTIDRTLWVFGGEDKTGAKQRAVWSVSFDDMRWIQHPDMPSDRVGGQAVYDGKNAFLVYGGCAGADVAAGTCAPFERFDVVTQTWTPLAAGPGQRLQAGLAMEDDTLWLYAGVDPVTGELYRDTWSYLGGWTSYGPSPVFGAPVGPTIAAGTGPISTMSGGFWFTWVAGVAQSTANFGQTTVPTCMWESDTNVYVWLGNAAGDVYVCSTTNGICVQDDSMARASVAGVLCGAVDATLWSYGGGDEPPAGDTGDVPARPDSGFVDSGPSDTGLRDTSTLGGSPPSFDTSTLDSANNDLWRYHDRTWKQMMNGAADLSGGG